MVPLEHRDSSDDSIHHPASAEYHICASYIVFVLVFAADLCYGVRQKGGDDMHGSQDIRQALAAAEYSQRESLTDHLPYDREAAFYRCITQGDKAGAMRCFTPLGQAGFGQLSEDPLRSMRYHLVISVAFIARHCMAAGLSQETAFTLSDLYIRRIDQCPTEEGLNTLHRELVAAYADLMAAPASRQPLSRPVTRCVEYIHTHLHERITTDDLCAVCRLSRAYLSRLFRQETGLPVARYIMSRKIKAARDALEFTDQPVADIAHVLAFCSESHFIRVFHQHTGLTPGEYRRRNHVSGT